MIVPARNEAEVIERCVVSILGSSYGPLELIVVDDRSTDDTAAIVARLAARDPRLQLVHGADLPAGWFGKPWACVQGYRAATGELLCFTDADTIHEPDLLAHSVGALEAMEASLFTVLGGQICLGPAERLVLPQIFYLLLGKFHPRAVNRARSDIDVIANGQYLMMSRTEYERVGTHERVHGEVAEDLALGQEVFRAGGKVRMAYANDLIRTRMYTDWRHIREGWSKNLALGSRRGFQRYPVLGVIAPWLVALVFIGWLVPPVILGLSWAGIETRFETLALAATCLSALFWMTFDASTGIPFYWGLGYPVGALGALYITLRSIFRGGRKVEWKGRVYGTDIAR